MNRWMAAKLSFLFTGLVLLYPGLAHADALKVIQAAHNEMDSAADQRDFVGASVYLSPNFMSEDSGNRGKRGNRREYLQELNRTYKQDSPDITYVLHTTTHVVDVTPGDTQKLWGVVFAKTEREESIVAHFSERLRKPYGKGIKISGRHRPPAEWPITFGQKNWEVWVYTGSGWREIFCNSYMEYISTPID